MEQKIISEWNRLLNKATPQETLQFFVNEFHNKICLSSSMGAEDQVLTDMLVRIDTGVRIITLDTGRLFPDTLNLIEETNKHYSINIGIFFPDYKDVQKMVHEKGINLFYKSIENRKLCCHIRKVEPLIRALKGMQAWITGIRKDQTIARFQTSLVEWDEEYGIVKINPLYRWTEKMVWEYIHMNKTPFNKLYDQGYRSIGCQPCTRAVATDEDPRAGRWWWEDQGHKECGLHNA